MQKQVRTKLLTDYSQLKFKGKGTCVKYRYDYNGVTVNLYFDAFDPASNTLTMILSTEKQFYFTTLNSMSTRIRKVIIPELSEPPVRTLGATIPENESHIFR